MIVKVNGTDRMAGASKDCQKLYDFILDEITNRGNTSRVVEDLTTVIGHVIARHAKEPETIAAVIAAGLIEVTREVVRADGENNQLN